MCDVIYVKLDIVYSIKHQLNETISRKSYFLKLKSKVIISLFETVRLSVSTSPRNLYNSLKSIKENAYFFFCASGLNEEQPFMKDVGANSFLSQFDPFIWSFLV